LLTVGRPPVEVRALQQSSLKKGASQWFTLMRR
jgi:hypothetical protein